MTGLPDLTEQDVINALDGDMLIASRYPVQMFYNPGQGAYIIYYKGEGVFVGASRPKAVDYYNIQLKRDR